MKNLKVLLFAGTSEGRACARALCNRQVKTEVCLATGYGETMLREDNLPLTYHVGRLTAAAMKELMLAITPDCVIDATHPYAIEASSNIRQACSSIELPYYRLLRERSSDSGILVSSAEEAAAELNRLQGNIMLTTGSKELRVFSSVTDYQERIYPRILPSISSLQNCLDLGYKARNIIAMHGPFNRELNEALLKQYNIKILVTKNSGEAGGYHAKVAAALATETMLITIGMANETGYSLDDLLQLLCEGGT